MRAAAGTPIDVVLDLLPPLPDSRAVRAAAMAVRAHGTVVLMGGLRVGLELPYDHLMRNCITVRGQFMYSRNAPARLAALIRSGMLSLDHFEPVRFALDDIDAAIAHAADNSGPFRLTVVTPSSIAST